MRLCRQSHRRASQHPPPALPHPHDDNDNNKDHDGDGDDNYVNNSRSNNNSSGDNIRDHVCDVLLLYIGVSIIETRGWRSDLSTGS